MSIMKCEFSIRYSKLRMVLRLLSSSSRQAIKRATCPEEMQWTPQTRTSKDGEHEQFCVVFKHLYTIWYIGSPKGRRHSASHCGQDGTRRSDAFL